MLYKVTHRTTYVYKSDVSHSHHVMHLRPRDLPRQRVLDFALRIDPEPSEFIERADYYGNLTRFFTLATPHRRLAIVSQSHVRVTTLPAPNREQAPAWEAVRERCAEDVLNADTEQAEYCFDSPHITRSPVFGQYAAASFPRGARLLDGVIDLTARICRDFKFDPRATTVATPLHEVFQKRRGVCQDFAHLAIACLRSLGLPARYVSGYLETVPAPGRARLVGADASHAWFSAWCPVHGWIDADPTNNVLPGERHIALAWGRDYSDVSPVRGVIVGGGRHALSVGVDVERAANED